MAELEDIQELKRRLALAEGLIVELRSEKRHRSPGFIDDVNVSPFGSHQSDTFERLHSEEQSRAALRRSEERLDLALEATDLAVYEWDLVSDHLIVNKRFREIVGVPMDESVVGASVLRNCVHADDLPRIEADLTRAMDSASDGKFDFEHRVNRPSTHGDAWVLSHGQVFFTGPAGSRQPRRVFGTLQDITERKRAEFALRESEERYRDLFERMGEGFCIIEVVFEGDRAVDYVFIEANPAFLHQTDITNAVGRSMRDIAPDHEEHWFEKYGEVARTGQPMRFEAPARQLGNRWYDVNAFRVGEPEQHRVAIVFTDITQRRRDTVALRESEEKYRSLFDSIDEGFTIFEVVRNHQGRPVDLIYREANTAFERVVGYKPSPGVPAKSVFPEIEQEWLDFYNQVAVTGVSVEREDYTEALDKWLRVQASRVGLEGSPLVAVVFEDVTERKRAEIVLRESEERQAFLLKLSDAIRPLADVAEIQGETTRRLREQLKAGWCYYVDWDLDRMVGRVLRDATREGLPSFAGEHDVSDAPEFLQSLLGAGEVITVRDYTTYEQLSARIRQKFSSLGFQSMMVAPLIKDGRLLASLLVGDTEVRDWSSSEASLLVESAERTWAAVERARVEEALRESERKYRSLFERIDEGFCVIELVQGNGRTTDYRLIEVNPAFENQSGLFNASGKLGTEVAPSGDEAAWLTTYEEVAQSGKAQRFERYHEPTERWYSVYVAPAEDADPLRLTIVFADITLRKQAETALRESEERYRTLYTSMEQGYIEVELIRDATGHAVDYRYMVLNPAYERLTGIPIEKALGRPSLEVIPDLSPVWAETFQRIVDNHASEEFEYEEKALDRWYGIYAYPRSGDRLTVLALDITQRKKAEVALRESEGRFRQFADASAAGLWIRDAETLAMEFVSPAMGEIYGIEPGALLGDVRRWAALVVPDDRETALRHLEEAREGKSVAHEFRIRRRSDGAFRWIRNTDFPLRDGDEIQRIGGIAEDISEAKLSAEHQAVLLAELQHRVRNIMAMIRSVGHRTAKNARDVADYTALMSGRLMSLARTQALLTRAANVSVDLQSLLLTELSAQAHDENQYSLSGPTVEISSKAAEVLSLAVHELTTNALKYGALSVAEGRIDVVWQVTREQDSPVLRLWWTEARPPITNWTAPTRRGFGSELVERRVPYELDGEGKVELTPEGARVSIAFPLQPGASILETSAPVRKSVYGGSIDMSKEQLLAGQRILVVEDDYLLAYDTQTALESAGARVVGPFAKESEAAHAIREGNLAAALTDINLGKGPSFEIAKALQQAHVPFAFLTGYDQSSIPNEFAEVPRLVKPIDTHTMVKELSRILQGTRGQADGP